MFFLHNYHRLGLYPDTTYWVNVQVVNEAGYGPQTDDLPQNTLRAAPKEAPQEVHLHIMGWDSIRVTWRGVSTDIQEEPLEGYRVSTKLTTLHCGNASVCVDSLVTYELFILRLRLKTLMHVKSFIMNVKIFNINNNTTVYQKFINIKYFGSGRGEWAVKKKLKR